MKRIVACAMGFMLAVGLMPLPAFAEESLHAQSLSTPSAAGATSVNATFSDQKLYDAMVSQLDEQGVACTADPDAKSIALSAAEAAKVESLNLGYSEISDLTGIEALAGLPNLRRLDLDHNALDGDVFAPLSSLTQLTYLDLYDNKPDNWSFLATLVNLEHLNIAGVKRHGASREALRNLKKLKWLDFSWSGRDDAYEKSTGNYNYIIDVVSELTELEYLNLCGWYNISNLQGTTGSGGIGNLTKLKTLILNYNYVQDLTPLLACTQLEELHLAYGRINWNKNADNLACLLDESGNLTLPLKKLDLRKPDDRADYFVAGYPSHETVNKLYRLHKQGKLELGYDWRWIDELAGMQPHVDSTGARYIAYEDFGTFRKAGSDDWWAMQNAHDYANEHGCEVRSVVGEGAAAAQGKTYHIYRLHDAETFKASTNIDWQGATIYVHDEELDWHYAANKRLLDICPSPADFADAGKLVSANTRTLEAGATGAGALTVNAGKLPLKTTTTSIKGLSPEVDAAIADLAAKGFSRFYVQLYDSNITRYNRGYTYKQKGGPQWDALIVDANGAVKRLNAAKLAGADTPAGSFIPSDPDPLQWQFDHVTKVVVAPIADEQAHIRNARFVTMPLNSRQQLPKDRWSSDYVRVLGMSGTNFELGNVTQTLGTAETGWDHDTYSGLYVGFLNLSDCAELDMHDCYAWDRVCTRSTYGINTTRMIGCRFKNVGDSNPVRRSTDWGNHGGNLAKHMLWENVAMGRIDQHTGCYDMAVRDSDLGSLALTGAGPLTVERTEVASGHFLNLRGDYGSTWDGTANVIDCTHHVVMDAKQEPCGFAASTPQPDWDFGYPQKFPELHVKNLTIDCAHYYRGSDGTRYRVTYGFPSNHANGLNLLNANSVNEHYRDVDYWPDTLEVDGVNIVNFSESLGHELHVSAPLNMLGKPAKQVRSGAWTVDNVSYDGEPFASAAFEGSDELVVSSGQLPFELAPKKGEGEPKKYIYATFGATRGKQIEEALATHDVAIAYTGDEPRFLLRHRNVKGEGYADAFPYFVEHRGETNVAYYSGRELLKDVRLKQVEAPSAEGTFYAMLIDCPDSAGSNGETGVTGNAVVQHVRLVSRACGRDWGAWTRVDDRSHQRVCSCETAHVQLAPHEWDAGVVTRAATTEAEGVRTYTCSVCNATRTEAIPKLPVQTPKGTKLKKLTAGKKSFTAKWAKQANDTAGYQLQYATKSNFKKGAKIVAVKGAKKTSCKVRKLKAAKKYWVRIRTYKTVSGKLYASKWSSSKRVKTKR